MLVQYSTVRYSTVQYSVGGDLLVGLECGGQRGLALLAAHQAGAQQVHDDNVPVESLDIDNRYVDVDI